MARLTTTLLLPVALCALLFSSSAAMPFVTDPARLSNSVRRSFSSLFSNFDSLNNVRQDMGEEPEPMPSASPDVDDETEGADSPKSSPSITPSPSAEMTMTMEMTMTVEPSTSPDDGEICVDEAYLHARGVPTEHMVHRESITAQEVFCPKDSSLPCATANHQIRVHGRPLSYRAYCTRVAACTTRSNVRVNSVLSHIWAEKPDEHAPGVTLTMFDARHPEMMQKVLHRFISVSRRFTPQQQLQQQQ